MKAAVVISGHYRSFEYLSDHIKQTYKGCDFYFCLWDHNYRYKSVTSKATNQVKMETYLSEELDIDSVERFISKEYGTSPVFVSSQEYMDFVNKIPNAYFLHEGDKRGRYAQQYLMYRAQSLLKGEYDIVFRQRPDVYQPFPIPLFKIAEEVKIKSQKKGSEYVIWTPRVHIKRGYCHIDDTFFYGSHSSMDKLLGNLAENLFNLLDNKLIKQGEKEYFYYHKVLGSLLLQTRVDDVIELPQYFKNYIIRYPDVVNNTLMF